MSSEHTPGPWDVGEYNDILGYDCMFGGIRVGPAVLDGKDYGQSVCSQISEDSLARMQADGRLIGAAPTLLTELRALVAQVLDYERVNNLAPAPGRKYCWDVTERAVAAIARATGSETREG